jgi:tRNA A-37 threonylcarbamoyl transferase component Bud32
VTDPILLEQADPNRYLNHFRLDQVIASGGMGKVYLGFDTSLQRKVALKVIRPELANQDFADRFLREARAQAQIAHSNVVQVYFAGQDRGVLFMAMEWVDGGSLADTLQGGKRLSWQECVRHMRGLAEGLREAARLNIIHRDIKPANILLDRFGLAHLADFGLAAPVNSKDRMLEPVPQTTTLPNLTQLGTVLGSPSYMSPEQARADALDTRSDIYSLGATFYELLCGEAPTQASSLNELVAFFTGPAPQRLTARAPSVPRGFAALIDRCMARPLALRFQSYDELIDALDKVAPRPEIPAAIVSRVLAWSVDVAVFAAASRFTVQLFAPAGFLALSLWVTLGLLWVGSTPGQWMMRTMLRRPGDLPVSLMRGLTRFLVQHGWLAFLSLTLAAVYRSKGTGALSTFAAVTALGFLLGVAGSLGVLFTRARRSLVDVLTGTEVLVDVRGST